MACVNSANSLQMFCFSHRPSFFWKSCQIHATSIELPTSARSIQRAPGSARTGRRVRYHDPPGLEWVDGDHPDLEWLDRDAVDWGGPRVWGDRHSNSSPVVGPSISPKSVHLASDRISFS